MLKLEQDKNGKYKCPNCQTKYNIIEKELDIYIKNPDLSLPDFCDVCGLCLEIYRDVKITYGIQQFSDKPIYKTEL